MAENVINTAEKKDDIDIQQLWKAYSASHDLEMKNALIEHYLYLVKGIVLRMMPTYHGYNEYDDLVSCGVLGLMDAVEKFDINRDIKFETYAYMRIRGEIIDHMRKQDWAPSSLRRRITQVNNTFDELEAQFGRPATELEVADKLGIDIQELQKILEKSHVFNVLYFEDMLSESYAANGSMQSTEAQPEAQLENDEIRDTLAGIIDTLPENERMVITLYYFEEMPLKDIAEVLDVSPSRVSQIHSKVLGKLRTSLQQYME